MENFFLNLANGWTVIDLIIMISLSVLAYRLHKKVKTKEKLLNFSDIERSQLKGDILSTKKQIELLKIQNDVIQKKYLQKKEMLSRCIDRPRENGKFIKANFKKVKGYKAKEDIFNSENELVFKIGNEYNTISGLASTLIGEDQKKYMIDLNKFNPVY